MEGNILVNLCALCALTVGFSATLALLITLAPGFIERARRVARQRPGQSFLLGLVNLAFFLALPMIALGMERLRINLGNTLMALSFVPVMILLPSFMLIGFTIAAGIVGEQFMLQTLNRPISPLVSLTVGALLCILVALVPIIGWTFLLILILVGMGAAVIAFVQQARKHSSAVEEELE